MTENNENMIPISHDRSMTCENCTYKSYYFLEEDENETLNVKCLASYFNLMTDLTCLEGHISLEQIYLVIPRFEKLENNFCIPQFVINTCRGVIKHYQDGIKKSLYNKLLLILAKSSLSMAMLPLALAIKKKTIYVFVKTTKQYEIVKEIFPATEGYKLISMNVGTDKMPSFIPESAPTTEN